MSHDLQRLADARPVVTPLPPQARAAARARLAEAIATEAPGAVAESPRPPARRPRVNAGALVAVLGSLAAIAIAVGALALAHHRHGAVRSAASADSSQRGTIVTSDGTVLAGVGTRYSVVVDPTELPRAAAARNAEERRLSFVAFGRGHGLVPGTCTAGHTPLPGGYSEDGCLIAIGQAEHPGHPVTLMSGMSAQTVAPIMRDHAAFPGVTLTPVSVRTYPHGTLAAQVLGRFWRSGVEDEYGSQLRAGDALQLALSAPLERVGQRSLARAIAANPGASGGAYVAMDPTTGAILALGSAPTYDPSVFTAPVSAYIYHQHQLGPKAGDPLFDRAIAGGGPVGSVFKPLTALAAMQSGAWQPDEQYDDTGEFCLAGSKLCLHNSGHATHGSLNVASALRTSDDLFFYHLGALLNSTAPGGGVLQDWARKFGIGQPTGIDLPGASSGALTSSTTIGDTINTAVGQGQLSVTPLQVAVAYAALANGGTIVTPHVGSALTTPAGATTRIAPAPVRHLRIDPKNLRAVLQGLRQAASAPGGTNDDVMGNLPFPVYGKSGTAEYNGQPDYAWYAGFVPASATHRPIVVVTWIERGGFGDVAAAPVARQLLSQWLLGKPGPYVAGTSTTL